MRVVEIRERSIPISRYADPSYPSGGLTTSAVALTTDVVRDGRPVVGYGFSSIGRFAQSGLIRERFGPRLLAAPAAALTNDDGTNIDPFRVWATMMAGEKPGGHGERCVAVGTLDMAVWDAAAKIAELPLDRFLSGLRGEQREGSGAVPVYAGGGYLYPDGDLTKLSDELRGMVERGYTHAKIKIGALPLAADLRRIDAARARMPADGGLAVDAMNSYDPAQSMAAAAALAPLDLWWFEDISDPLDFETSAAVAQVYAGPIAAGEALFSVPEAKLLHRYGGLRPDRDILLFDPVHCYGLPGFLRILDTLEASGWRRSAFWPHGGHLFTLHVAAALGLGGAEVNPFCFQPFGGLGDGAQVSNGTAIPPSLPGIGFEAKAEALALFRSL